MLINHFTFHIMKAVNCCCHHFNIFKLQFLDYVSVGFWRKLHNNPERVSHYNCVKSSRIVRNTNCWRLLQNEITRLVPFTSAMAFDYRLVTNTFSFVTNLDSVGLVVKFETQLFKLNKKAGLLSTISEIFWMNDWPESWEQEQRRCKQLFYNVCEQLGEYFK